MSNTILIDFIPDLHKDLQEAEENMEMFREMGDYNSYFRWMGARDTLQKVIEKIEK